MARQTWKPGTMVYPVPAAMVTVADKAGNTNIITIAWTGTVCSDPPMTYVSIKPERYSHHMVEETGEFVINLTTETLSRAVDFCGVKSGRDVDKWKETGLTAKRAEKVRCPLIEESPVNLECRVSEIREYPSHDMFIAEILQVHVDESLFDEKGRIALDEAGLLCYSHGEYFGVKKKPVGRFGFSVMKAKTRKRINRENWEKQRKTRKRRD